MQKLSKKTSTCRVTRLILLMLGLLLWQAQAMAQGDASTVDQGGFLERQLSMFSSNPLVDAGEITVKIPSSVAESLKAQARQVTPGQPTESVESAFVYLLPDLSGSSQRSGGSTGGSGSSDDSDSSSRAASRQEPQTLWYVGLLDPTLSAAAQGVRISRNHAATIPPTVTPDGSLVGFVGADFSTCLIDMQTGEENCALFEDGILDVALSPDGSMIWMVPRTTSGDAANYLVVLNQQTGEASPVQITDESGQDLFQSIMSIDISADGQLLALDALMQTQDESGAAVVAWVLAVIDMQAGQILGALADPRILFVRPSFANASSNYLTFEAISLDESEEASTLAILDLTQGSAAGVYVTLAPALPGFNADDSALYFTAPMEQAQAGFGIASLPVDVTTLQATGNPEAVLPNAVFGDAYAAGGQAGGGGTGGTAGTGAGGTSGDDDSSDDASDDSDDSGTSSS